VRKAEADAGVRKDLLSTEEREELKPLRGEVRELRRANDILKSASAFFGDFTYLRSWEGTSYFAFVIDAFSRKVVGWQLASHMRTDLVLDALRMALGQREPGADVELVAHTDRGSQYTSATTPRPSATTASWRWANRKSTSVVLTTRSGVGLAILPRSR
jgi:transposase InsO family protein